MVPRPSSTIAGSVVEPASSAEALGLDIERGAALKWSFRFQLHGPGGRRPAAGGRARCPGPQERLPFSNRSDTSVGDAVPLWTTASSSHRQEIAFLID